MIPEPAIDSRDWLRQAQQGDPEAFCELCRAYETPLLRQAMLLCGDTAQAEDLAQETLVEAWKSLGHYGGRCQFLTWLCAILINRFRNSLRKKRILALLPFLGRADEAASVPDNSPRPDEAALLGEQAAIMRRCVEALPFKQRQVIYLRFYVDDSLEGIAAALGCSLGTVKSRLFNALEKLRGMNEMKACFKKDTI